MTGKEVSVNLTKKRTSVAMDEQDSYLQSPSKKRRVPLGEISNLSVLATEDLDTGHEKLNCIEKGKGVMVVEQKVNDVQEVETRFDDSQMCHGYVNDIYDYLHNLEKEAKRRPLQNYMDAVQKEATANMRGVLVDWLVEVAQEYKLQSDTLYLSVSYIDKFLSFTSVSKNRLQLLGVSAMLIASKFEEIDPPTIDDFCYITDNSYSKEDVVKMEADILKCLKFELSSPTTMTFLRRFVRISEDCNDPDLKFELLGCYLAELSLLDYGSLKFLPSMIASSVIFLSRLIFYPDTHPWSANLQKCTGYKPADLKECILRIQDLRLSKRGGCLVAIREKYIQHKFKYVGLLKCPSEIPSFFFEGINEGN